MKKWFLILGILSFLIGVGLGALSAKNNASHTPSDKETEKVEEEDKNKTQKPIIREVTKDNEEDDEPLNKRVWTFIGLIDNNSANFKGQYEDVIVARFPDAYSSKVNELSEGDKITVLFKTNQHGQYVIQEIK